MRCTPITAAAPALAQRGHRPPCPEPALTAPPGSNARPLPAQAPPTPAPALWCTPRCAWIQSPTGDHCGRPDPEHSACLPWRLDHPAGQEGDGWREREGGSPKHSVPRPGVRPLRQQQHSTVVIGNKSGHSAYSGFPDYLKDVLRIVRLLESEFKHGPCSTFCESLKPLILFSSHFP